MSFIGCNILGSDGVGSKIYQPLIDIANRCNVSIYSDGTYNKFIKFVSEPPEPLTGDIDIIGYRDPLTGYFSGVPLSDPVTPVLSGDNDRPIGNDYNGSYIAFNTSKSDTILHKDEWELWFYVNKNWGTTPNQRVYTEGLTTDADLLYSIGMGFSNGVNLKVFIRDELGVIHANNETTLLNVFDGNTHLVGVVKDLAGNITVYNDGDSQVITTGFTGSITKGDTSTLGAVNSTTLTDFAVGNIWDLNKDGQLIPINEGTGTDIYGADGDIIGTLVDPLAAFWDYSISTWKLLEDKPCNTNKLLLDDNNIALQDDLGAFLFGD